MGHAALTLQIKQALVDSAVSESDAARTAFATSAPLRFSEALAKAGLMLQASGQYATASKAYRWAQTDSTHVPSLPCIPEQWGFEPLGKPPHLLACSAS